MSIGKYVDIKFWDSGEYESRVRGLYLPESEPAAMELFDSPEFRMVEMSNIKDHWITLSGAQEIVSI